MRNTSRAVQEMVRTLGVSLAIARWAIHPRQDHGPAG